MQERREFFTQVQEEDFYLCEKTQVNLNTGIYSQGVRKYTLYFDFNPQGL